MVERSRSRSRSTWGEGLKPFLGALVAACSGGQHYTRVLPAKASRELSCPVDQVTVQRRRAGEHVARGCGRQAVYQCHQWDGNCDNLNEVARQRAHRDTRCEPVGITSVEVGPHLFQTQGCGASATYFCEMRRGISTCVNEAELQRR